MGSAFSDRVAVVTGGGQGLGAALCRALAIKGARVVVADLSSDKAKQVADEINGHPAQVDVADPGQVDHLLQSVASRFGSLDLLINNAGVFKRGAVGEHSIQDWNHILSVNLTGVVAGSLAAFQIMKNQRSGQILNISSMSGLSLIPGSSAYSASKAGVLRFSRELALEAAYHGVGVSVACPGNIGTPLLQHQHISSFTPLVSPDCAASKILRSLERRKQIIIFPGYARIIWWLDRLSPHLLDPFRREMIKRARARQLSRLT